MTFKSIIFGLSLIVAAGSASAQSLTDVKGNVLVNTGAGYVKASGASDIGPGASVMARQGGSAVIRYADGCQVKVQPGKVSSISAVSPCSFVAADLPASGNRNDPGAPVIVAGDGGFGLGGVALAGLVAAGGLVAIIAISRSNNGNSP